VLLQGEVGACGGVFDTVQEESFADTEERDRDGADSEGDDGVAAVSRDGRWAMGLPGDDHVQERGDCERQFRQQHDRETVVCGSGHVQEGRTAAVRDSGGALGCAGEGSESGGEVESEGQMPWQPERCWQRMEAGSTVRGILNTERTESTEKKQSR